MSLFFDLRVTDGPAPSSLGLLEVQRADHRDVAVPGADTVCTYSVRLDGADLGMVSHRYGDPPWTLAAKAADLAGLRRRLAETATPAERVRAAAYLRQRREADGHLLFREVVTAANTGAADETTPTREDRA